MKAAFMPMLATAAAPFDGEDYEFEVKWDGVRALAAVEHGHWRLWGRAGADYTARYPELAVLQRLPAGTVVDGEIVVLHQGRADFPALLRRHQRRQPSLAAYVGPGQAVCYMLFDVLAVRGRSILKEPLRQRRERLHDLLEVAHDPVLCYSDGVIGRGREFFTQAVAQGHEGVMAKHLASRYCPGTRSPAWRKVKPVEVLPCVIIGYTAGRSGIERLLVATVRDGVLRYVGQLTRGFGNSQAAELAERLARRRRLRPVVPCPMRAWWVEPELYCRVQCQGWTCHGQLRHAVFRGLLDTSKDQQ
jgi:bifunctional non-homologous end joining protein LigD